MYTSGMASFSIVLLSTSCWGRRALSVGIGMADLSNSTSFVNSHDDDDHHGDTIVVSRLLMKVVHH